MKMGWRTEPVLGEMSSDDLWLGVTRQSNTAIAGSLRNSFRAGLGFESYGGRALIEYWAGLPVPYSVKLRMP